MRVAGALKRVADQLLPHGPAARTIPFGPARGLRMEIDFSHQTRLYLGVFEIELARWFRRFCPPGAAAFDIGAREGYVALVLARLSHGGRVLAVEAAPGAYEELQRNVALNTSLARAPDARLARVTDRSHGSDVSLDDLAFAADGFVPDLVKLDVEGWELKALQGADRLLAERRPHFVVETHTAELERSCIEHLVAAGYAPRIVEPRRWLPEVRAGHNRWLVAQGRPPEPASSPIGARPREIGTESAHNRAPESHRRASEVDSVEHEGGGWYPTLDGWGTRHLARADMSA